MKSKTKKAAKANRSVSHHSAANENKLPSNAAGSVATPLASHLASSPPKSEYFNLFSNALSVQNLDPKTLAAGSMSPRCHAEKHSLELPDFEPKKRSSSCLTDAEDYEEPFELPGVAIDEHIFDSDRLPEVDFDFSCDARDRAISLSSNDSWDSLDFSTLLFDY